MIQYLNRILQVTFLFLCFNAWGQDIPEPMSPPRLVNDYVNILSQNEWQDLEQHLRTFNQSTSTQIALAIVPSLNGYDASSFAFELGEKWGVGQKDKDNGIVIVIKPKTNDSRGQAFIATGYGVEHVVPDAIANQIVDNEMIPYFKQNDYYSGIKAAVLTLSDLTRGEYTASEYQQRNSRSNKGESPLAAIIVVLIFIFISFLGRARRARHYSVGRGIPFWVAMSMLGSSGRGHRGGGFSSFSSGSGGFGGFGGGSFGGGGAGGSW